MIAPVEFLRMLRKCEATGYMNWLSWTNVLQSNRDEHSRKLRRMDADANWMGSGRCSAFRRARVTVKA
jgi:hypothetical protein